MSEKLSNSQLSNNKRLAKNTLFMYFRMIFVMVISLFTSRINLQMLGVEDYGIYNVVGGFVAMFSVFSNALSAAIQRFITYELGKDTNSRINKVFSTSVTVMIAIALVLMLSADIVGVWFVNNKMVLPPERITAAVWVLHFSVITFGINLISVPYNAVIVAHERMSVFAYVSIYEVIAKLVVCYCLYISPIDKLVLWAIMIAVVQISIRIFYGSYCKRKFAECSYKPLFDKTLFNEIAKYAGWSTFGLVAYTCYTQGINMVLNLFFGPIINAARGIAVQVQSAVQGFSTNFQIAMNPQIIKSYAQQDMDRLHSLLFAGTRFCYYVLLLLSLPIILQTPMILRLWLGEFPDHTVNFVRLILVIITFDSSFGGPISTAQTATGKIKVYQLVVGGIMLSILPVSYLILKVWHTCPETVYYVYLGAVLIAHIARMIIIRNMVNISLLKYLEVSVKPICLVTLLSLPLPLIANFYMPKDSLFSFLIVCTISVLCVASTVYFIGITPSERLLIKSKLESIIHKNE